MIKIEQNEIQPLILDILKSFHSFCERKNLTFILAGGTLLGAIRHRGFIPWDDDIDLYMLKKDYENLLLIAKECLYIDSDCRYKILLPSDESNIYPFVKIIDTKTVVYEKNIDHKYSTGLWIDVFCLDYWPNDVKQSKNLYKKQRFYTNCNKIVIAGNFSNRKMKVLNIIVSPIKIFFKIFKMDNVYWCKKITALASLKKTNFVGNLIWPSGLDERFPIDYFNNLIKTEFEGDLYYIPQKYDSCLKNQYGNYMQLPQEKDRVSHDIEGYYR